MFLDGVEQSKGMVLGHWAAAVGESVGDLQWALVCDVCARDCRDRRSSLTCEMRHGGGKGGNMLEANKDSGERV